MRVITLVFCALLISAAAAQQLPKSDCVERAKELKTELKALVANTEAPFAEKMALIGKVFGLAKDCILEFMDLNSSFKILSMVAEKPIEPIAVSAASTEQCAQWRFRVELLKKLIQDPYTRTDRVLGEYAETLNRIQREC